MKRFINICLFITSLFGYLEWGKNQHSFIFQAEAEIFSKLFSNPQSFLHPFILIPLFGQLLLLYTIISKQQSKALTITAILFIGLLMLLLLFIGIIDLNYKILFSTFPFLITAIIALRIHFKKTA
ncbi:MAG: hypothetical protein QM725_00215 [Lacibacter sp.]